MVIPLFVGREKSILALEQAMKVNKQILLLAQKQADVDDPQPKDLYQVGTIATILQLLKLPDGTVKVLVEGTERASVAVLTRAITSLRRFRRSATPSSMKSAKWTCSCARSFRSSSSM
jgi:ATP-dependent Lon protease